MTRTATLVLAGVLFFTPCAALAAEKRELTVTPLVDDSGGGNTQGVSPPGPQPDFSPAGQERTAAPAASGVAGEGGQPSITGAERSSARDGMVISYLIDLARKQSRPCPSGKTPPAPPSLTFSEPLCRVAEAMGSGKDFPAALAEQGLYAERWRMFSAADASAQKVTSSLRQMHCEELLEPHTHIGAVRDASGWRIVLAVLTDKKPAAVGQSDAQPSAGAPEDAAKTGGAQTASAAPVAVPASVPASAQSSLQVAAPSAQTQPQADPAPAPARTASDSALAPVPAQADTAGLGGREARTLFLLLNDLRAKGGSCLGKPKTTAPPLSFDPVLQAAAESDAANAAAAGSFAAALGQAPDKISGVENYPGTNISKLTIRAGTHASVVLDAWLVSPTRCEVLLSPRFADAGVAYDNGHWVLLLGEKSKGVPSPEIPASRRKSAAPQEEAARK